MVCNGVNSERDANGSIQTEAENLPFEKKSFFFVNISNFLSLLRYFALSNDKVTNVILPLLCSRVNTFVY